MNQGGFQPKKPGLATASLILGIASFILPFLAILSIIFGIIALRKIKQENLGGRGFAIAGIILGVVAILLAFIIMSFIWSNTVTNIEESFKEERVARENLDEKCNDVKFEILSVGPCTSSSTSCDVTIQRQIGGETPDEIVVIIEDDYLYQQRMEASYTEPFSELTTKTITVTGQLDGEPKEASVWAYISDEEGRKTLCGSGAKYQF